MKIKNMSLKRLQLIAADPYFRSPNGKDYDMYKDEILNRIWELTDRKSAKQLKRILEDKIKEEKQREEWELYNNFILQEGNFDWIICNFRFLMDVGFFNINNIKNNLT